MRTQGRRNASLWFAPYLEGSFAYELLKMKRKEGRKEGGREEGGGRREERGEKGGREEGRKRKKMKEMEKERWGEMKER